MILQSKQIKNGHVMWFNHGIAWDILLPMEKRGIGNISPVFTNLLKWQHLYQIAVCWLLLAQHSVWSPPLNWLEKLYTLGWRNTLCKWKISKHIRLAVVPPPYCWTLQSLRQPSCSYSEPKTGQRKPHSLCKIITAVRIHIRRKSFQYLLCWTLWAK